MGCSANVKVEGAYAPPVSPSHATAESTVAELRLQLGLELKGLVFGPETCCCFVVRVLLPYKDLLQVHFVDQY